MLPIGLSMITPKAVIQKCAAAPRVAHMLHRRYVLSLAPLLQTPSINCIYFQKCSFAATLAPHIPSQSRKPSVPCIESTLPTSPDADEEYHALRMQQLSLLNENPYPLAVDPSHLYSHPAFISTFDDLCQPPETWLDDSYQASITGRVVLRRDASKNLIFLVIERQGIQVQAIMNRRVWPVEQWDAFSTLSNAIGLGDIVFIHGQPGRTKAGQLSLRANSVVILAPCLHFYPKKHVLLLDENVRFRQRYLDMLVHPNTVQVFKKRSKIITEIRSFLDRRDFIEIETPVLSATSGGANAKPFKTRMDAMKLDLEMRIAPELYLKQLVIGGIERVYEIGKQFRNEGIDKTHNPEFTTCEFYQAFGTVEGAMKLTEDMIREIAQSVNGSTIVSWEASDGLMVEIDMSPPFRKIAILPALEEALGQSLPDVNDPASISQLLEICKEKNITLRAPFTVPRILDRLISHFIEPRCVQPTFLTGHPICMSPLAKAGTQEGIADRFELFIGTKELANAYLELNDPVEQRRRFVAQRLQRDQGDMEAQSMNEEFCVALEYGLPPTVGWGLGIDRMCMLLTQSTRIREVIPFPILRPIEQPLKIND
ncbi:hypothetical protein BASA50_002997 [Batrachochytrium salamandrivorans]|uniref:Lysine--tRNA ligase n=1 Tax=Batrachochytrium salamandrivorans TaxID=1357716 RepID=A0ABQ8FJY5_9FUNG|nr:hypothetical protein BASA62_004557 [Batrachochytrium salamandrivorans]KAH6571585.1 hypothetical protein BASA60_007109 [Batrachochytrium salamandrivorans]KAH6599483.1 hypothetical protein BASA50_002997 [Batrachochytrium salamandrivorans]KAH9267748.1 lysine-tRNA ligase [Batrachochytrium salamandrivorans]